MNTRRRVRIFVTGQVQGVGFRPFVWKRANHVGLTGFVINDSSGVVIELEGPPSKVSGFLAGFEDAAPPLAVVDAIKTVDIDLAEDHDFSIRESRTQSGVSTSTAPDIAVCNDCLSELTNEQDRRFRYPFINCTNCGPRFTIVKDIPYDRPKTTMQPFEMCPPCQREYEDPADRRYHAQPNACPQCGPRIWFVENAKDMDHDSTVPRGTTEESLRDCVSAIRRGGIVAIKGIGGFHLVCDAKNADAISLLRLRKGRNEKPLALMVGQVEGVDGFADVREEDRRALESPARPIVLLRKRLSDRYAGMLESVSPGNGFVGVMLPYSPLHYLLADQVSPMVMTSGNVSDEPIVRTNGEACDRLSELADGFLMHDREIHVVCDDSVVRIAGKKTLPIRRSRGYAPMPVRLTNERGTDRTDVLAVGGEIKATFCVTKDSHAYISQHIGDLGNLETLEAMERGVDSFVKLYRADIGAVAGDLHPSYLSSQWGRQLASRLDVPFVGIQHHHAHFASLIGEHGWSPEREIIACCLDGTGYGFDGAIWGGEFLIGNCRDFKRFACLDYFPLPGGDASIKRPYRTALALLRQHSIDWDEDLPCVDACGQKERDVLEQQIDRRINSPVTSSMGRLFDAAASLIGLRHTVSYEAQAAMELEFIAARAIDSCLPPNVSFRINGKSGEVFDRPCYGSRVPEIAQGQPISSSPDQPQPITIDPEPVVQGLISDLRAGMTQPELAARFHQCVAEMIVSVCQLARERSGLNFVGLTGGVFQNVLLLALAEARLRAVGFDVMTHSVVPPNDGGIALGQALIARTQLS